jgi:hypothetical protein
MSRRASVVALAYVLVVAMATLAGVALAGKGNGNDKTFQYAIGLWGDMPYNSVQERDGIPNLLNDLNDADLQFTVNDGDLKAGQGANVDSAPCDDPLYERAVGWLNSLEQPAMFTPGDNDWTDCDRTTNGGFNSLERLDHERALFFSTPNSLGMHTMAQEVQATPTCLGFNGVNSQTDVTITKDVPCVENRRWEFKNVMYVTVNVQGSCNNFCSSGAGDDSAGEKTSREAEYAQRNIAVNAWLTDSFAKAKASGDAAVMIIGQADPGFDLTGAPFAGTSPDAPTRDPASLDPAGANATSKAPGFKDFLTTLRTQTILFAKPVVYVHGDTHYFRVDKPLLDKSGKRIENFTRVETFGDNAANGVNDVHWVKALVDPQSRDVFAFQAQTVPGNVVSHLP